MNALVAIDQNWAIGCCDKLLFDLPKDRAFFKRTTIGNTVVYGSKTLRSFPNGKPLPGRRNIIFSRNPDFFVEGAEVVHSIEELKKLVDINDNFVYVIGGEQIYRLLLPYCTHVCVTKVFETIPVVDTIFPVNLDASPEWFSHDNGINYTDNGHICRSIWYQRTSK